MSDFRARLTANAEEFDTIISDVLAENEKLRTLLSEAYSYKKRLVEELEFIKAHQGESIGKRLTEEEMGTGYDRKSGDIVWWKMPPQGALIYTNPPTIDAAIEATVRKCAGLADSIFEYPEECGLDMQFNNGIKHYRKEILTFSTLKGAKALEEFGMKVGRRIKLHYMLTGEHYLSDEAVLQHVQHVMKGE